MIERRAVSNNGSGPDAQLGSEPNRTGRHTMREGTLVAGQCQIAAASRLPSRTGGNLASVPHGDVHPRPRGLHADAAWSIIVCITLMARSVVAGVFCKSTNMAIGKYGLHCPSGTSRVRMRFRDECLFSLLGSHQKPAA